jgi:hypothetical protein
MWQHHVFVCATQENVIPGIRTEFFNIPVAFIFSVTDVA